MCGIAGLCGRRAPVPALADMAARIAHRGPDGEGFAVGAAGDKRIEAHRPLDALDATVRGEHRVGLAHRRLAIIDLTDASRQPAVDETGSVALVCNGELYNYIELGVELRRRGHVLHTTGDTEVVLRAYLEWGPACVERFVGMWALALADLRVGRVLLSRDRFGIKPLYWTALPCGSVAFASEIKALAAIPGVQLNPDASAVRRYLVSGVV